MRNYNPPASELVPAREIVRELSVDYIPNVKQRKIHELILDAEIPAIRVGTRYFVERKNLSKIAGIIGATPRV